MDEQENKQPQARDQMHNIPGVINAGTRQTLPAQHQATGDTQYQDGQGYISKQLVVRQLTFITRVPVPQRKPGYRQQHDHANERVHNHIELVKNTERQQVNKNAGKGSEQQ